MNPHFKSLLLVAFVLAIPMSYAFHASATQKDDAVKTVKEWEHLAMAHDRADLGGDLSKQIVRLGSKGWELVCVTPIDKDGTTVKTTYYFKRPKN